MSRIGKQLVYGLIFVLFWTAVGALVYLAFIRPEPGCFNGRRDSGEEGVDCGGPCSAVCLPEGLRPLEALGEPRIFRSSPTTVGVLVRIQNPNLEVAAKSFNYRIDVYDASDRVLVSRSGYSFIYAGEIKYLADFISVANSQSVSRAAIVAGNEEWLPATRYQSPSISIQEKRAEVRDNSVAASGKFLNQDVTEFPQVQIVAVFYSNFNLPVGVSKTEVENVKIGESRTFSVIYPFSSSIDPAKTEYFVYARRP